MENIVTDMPDEGPDEPQETQGATIEPYPSFFDPAAAEEAFSRFVKSASLEKNSFREGWVIPANFYVHNRRDRPKGSREHQGGPFGCGMLYIGDDEYRCVRTIVEAVKTAKMRGYESILVLKEEKLSEELIDVIELEYPDGDG